MRYYEYKPLVVDVNDLKELNSLGSIGWRVASFTYVERAKFFALLERRVKDYGDIAKVRESLALDTEP